MARVWWLWSLLGQPSTTPSVERIEEVKKYVQQDLDFLMPSDAESATAAALNANATQVGGSHYKDAQVQPWNVVDTWPMEQRIGFYRGNALKYVMRMGTKDENVQEIKKAIHYLQKLVEVLDEPGR